MQKSTRDPLCRLVRCFLCCPFHSSDASLSIARRLFGVWYSFIKANAVNSNQVRDAHHESRRTSQTKVDGITAKALGKVKGPSDGKDATGDAKLVLYEFIALLVRIAFQRANPTFGNFGSDKKAIMHLPACLKTMLEEEVLPRARRDTSIAFRDTVMTELSVLKVLDAYRERLLGWYTHVTSDEHKTTSSSTSHLQMDHWLRICTHKHLVGTWSCRRESAITGDPVCKTVYKWSLSISQVRAAFMDSQPADSLKAGKSSDGAKLNGNDAMAVLDFEEFLETCARLGVDKYRATQISPAASVEGFITNLLVHESGPSKGLPLASPEEVVIRETYIHAAPYAARAHASKLNDESPGELEKWLECWSRIELMDLYLWPLWDKEVHDILHPLFKELQLIFLAYTRSISEDSAEDAMEMSMDEFHGFVVDVGLETKRYRFDVMSNQFVKVWKITAEPPPRSLALRLFSSRIARTTDIPRRRMRRTPRRHGSSGMRRSVTCAHVETISPIGRRRR